MLPRGHHIQLQFLSTIFANLLNLTYGLSIGWFIIYSDRFKTEDSPLNVPSLSSSEIKWIDLSFCGGALIGTIILTLAGDVFGRKYTLLVLAVPQALAWLLKMMSTNATEVFLGQFLSGFTAGGSVNLIILFTAELADDKIRGRLGTILAVSMNAGVLIIVVADLFLSYSVVACLALVFLSAFLCSFMKFPDTPRQLYKIRRKELAIRSLQLYRDIRDLEFQTDDCYQLEVKKMRHNLKSDSGLSLSNSWKASVKALIISLLLIILNVLINGFVTLNLINNQVLDMNQSNVQTFRIIIAICQLAGSVLCLMIIDFVERKNVLLASMAGIITSQILYGLIKLSVINGDHTTNVAIAFAIATFSLHVGIYPLTFVLVPEIIPEKIRIYGVTTLFTVYWLLTLGFSLGEWAFTDVFHNPNWQIFIACLIFNVICSIIFWILIPSTKQESYRNIFDELNTGL